MVVRSSGWQAWALVALGGLTLVLLSNFILVSVWPDLSQEVGARQALLLIAGAIILAVFLIVLLWQLPRRQLGARLSELGPGGQLNAENAARLTLAQIIGGLFLFIGLAFGWNQLRATEETVRLTQEGLQITRDELRTAQEGQITERFTRAIEQLGSDKLQIRLGGIYALERIARDSERDHEPIMQILAAFVRQEAVIRPRDASESTGSPPSSPSIADDTQAVLTVLLRRDQARDSSYCLDLSDTYLRGARLALGLGGTSAQGIWFNGADLSTATMYRVDLSTSNLDEANLSGANLAQARLAGALLRGATLRGAELRTANLSGANLTGADLSGANLSWADFQGETTDLGEESVDVTYAYTNWSDPQKANHPQSQLF